MEPRHIGPARWPRRLTVMLFCFIATFVCYLDRVNMSVAAIAMQKSYGWSETTKGLVLSAFFFGYFAFQIPSGWLANRYGGRRVMAAAILWWSLFTLLTPSLAAISLPVLIAARVAMGLGEAATFPAAYNLGARWFPAHERSRFVGVLLSGIPAGTLFALLTTGWFIGAIGWQAVFYVSGVAGVIVAIVWLVLIRDTPADHPGLTAGERTLLAAHVPHAPRQPVPWRRMLSSPAIWALVYNHFCSNWIIYFMATWLPSYFMATQHQTMVNAGFYSAVPWLTMIVTGNLSTHRADMMLKRGVDATFVRKLFQLLALSGAAAGLLLVRDAATAGQALACVCLTMGSLGLGWAGFSPNHLEIAPRHADMLVGISSTAGTLPGAIGVAITGWLVDRTGSYDTPFVAAAAIAITGAVVWLAFGTAKRVID